MTNHAPLSDLSARLAPRGALRRVGRYTLFDEVGHGGTATVHVGRWLAPGGFTKTVAIKRLHPSVVRDADVQAMFLDEARLAARIRHVNVVAMLDFLAISGEAFLVMEYVHGCSLASLQRLLGERGERVPPRIACRIVSDALAGLGAAHSATTDAGEPLCLIHRDVSPHNLQVGVDGVCRILDFGIAKAVGRVQDTHTGQLKGKLAYMAPEQLLGEPVDQRADLFAAGVVLWEALAGRRLFAAEAPGQTVRRIVLESAPDLLELAPAVPGALAAVVTRAIARDPAERFQSAAAMQRALEASIEQASSRQVGAWLEQVSGESLRRRTARLQEIESLPLGGEPLPTTSVSVRPTLAARAPADDLTRSDVRATLPSFGEVEAAPPESGVCLVAAPPPRPRKSRRWLVGVWGLAAVGSGWLVLRPEPVVAPSPAPVSPSAVALVPASPALTVTEAEAAVPLLPPTATVSAPRKPERRKPTSSTKPALPRAEDLFSRH